MPKRMVVECGVINIWRKYVQALGPESDGFLEEDEQQFGAADSNAGTG